MKKIGTILILTVAAVLLSGCGTWCSMNREYCIEGFSGYTRYPGGMYASANYYPFSHLTVMSNVKKGCYIDTMIDGVLMTGKIERGNNQLIYLKNKENENRTVSVLIREYCGPAGKEKFVDSYEASWAVSSTRQISDTWRITDVYFPQSIPRAHRPYQF